MEQERQYNYVNSWSIIERCIEVLKRRCVWLMFRLNMKQVHILFILSYT